MSDQAVMFAQEQARTLMLCYRSEGVYCEASCQAIIGNYSRPASHDENRVMVSEDRLGD
jgi:hypothetical protein